MHQVLAINFSDVFKSGFLESFAAFSIKDSLIGLGVSFLVGLFIFFIYAKSFSGVVYSASFNASLVLMTMITALIILGVTSNVVLSLGMVGALSIVRFRSAIKEPIDIVFIFWAISEGILCGAGLIPLALLGAPVIGGLLLLFSLRKDHSEPFLLIVRFRDRRRDRADPRGAPRPRREIVRARDQQDGRRVVCVACELQRKLFCVNDGLCRSPQERSVGEIILKNY